MKGCGKPINKDWDSPDWFCGEWMEEETDYEGVPQGRRYFCDECLKKGGEDDVSR